MMCEEMAMISWQLLTQHEIFVVGFAAARAAGRLWFRRACWCGIVHRWHVFVGVEVLQCSSMCSLDVKWLLLLCGLSQLTADLSRILATEEVHSPVSQQRLARSSAERNVNFCLSHETTRGLGRTHTILSLPLNLHRRFCSFSVW